MNYRSMHLDENVSAQFQRVVDQHQKPENEQRARRSTAAISKPRDAHESQRLEKSTD